MLLCKQTISSYIVEIHHHCVKKTRLLKDSMQRCNSIIQLTIIWWRLLCVRSCANNSLNPNVLLCSSQMSWSACDRIGVDLAVNCSVKSVVSGSWGKNEFHISSQNCDLDLDGESHKFNWGNKQRKSSNLDFKVKEQHANFHLVWRAMLRFSSSPGLYSRKCKAPTPLEWSLTPMGCFEHNMWKERKQHRLHRFGHLRRKKSRPRIKEGRTASLTAWF